MESRNVFRGLKVWALTSKNMAPRIKHECRRMLLNHHTEVKTNVTDCVNSWTSKKTFIMKTHLYTHDLNLCGWMSTSKHTVSPHLYIPHRWEHYSGTQTLCLRTPRTVLPLWPVLPGTCAWSVCTQRAPRDTRPPSQRHSRPPGALSSVHMSQCERTTRPHRTEGSSCGWSSMVWKTSLVPWTRTACWDSWGRTRCPDLAAEDCLDLSGCLKEKRSLRFTNIFNSLLPRICVR